MRRALVLLAASWLVLATVSYAQLTTVTAQLNVPTGSPQAQGTYAEFVLMYCGANQARVNGTALLMGDNTASLVRKLVYPTSLTPNISTQLYGNNVITCGTTVGNTRWRVTYYVNGQASSSAVYNILSTTNPFDLTSQVPVTVAPVIVAPTGDTTYARLDGGNTPFTGTVEFNGQSYFGGGIYGPVTFNGATTFNAAAVFPGGISGTTSFTGSICAPADANLNGVCYSSLAAAIASPDCPATGCHIDMSSPGANHNLGTVNAGTKPVDITLGFLQNYMMDHNVCSAGEYFHGGGAIGLGGGTLITSVGLNSQPLFVAPQANNYTANCSFSGFQAQGATGNSSQECFDFDVSTLTGAAIQNGKIEDVTCSGFNGSEFEVKGRPTDANSAFQFYRLVDFTLYSGAGPVSPIFKMTGYSGQNEAYNLFVNNQASGSTQDTMYLGPNGSTGTYAPTGNQFHNTTLQGQSGNVCLHSGGTIADTFDGGFVEACGTAVSATQDSSAIGAAGNNGLVVKDMYFAGSCCATAVLTDNDSNSQASLKNNTIFGTPGAFINGTYPLNVSFCDNYGPNSSTAGCYLKGPVTIGNGGSGINKLLRGSGLSLNSAFTSITAGTCQTQTLTLNGVATTGVASVSPASTLGTGFSIGSVWVSGTNTVSVSVCSGTTGTPNVVTYNVSEIQ